MCSNRKIMADQEGPQAPAPQGVHDPPAPQNPPPPKNLQIPTVPYAPLAPEAPELPVPNMPPLNWSHCKPKYSGKPDKDAEAHLLRTNDWMDIHRFQYHVKVQIISLTQPGEARLWYESLRLINIDWVGLQNTFRQQYSKIGYTREQLCHAWRSFHFDENAETIDAYINCKKKVTTLLGYQELQILEVFKNTLLTKLYWVLFPIIDLRQAVEMTKRILTKEKIDRQLAGQTSSTPFMSIKTGFSKKVTFNMMDSIEQKIDKLTVMMVKLVMEDEGQNRPFKPRVYQSNRDRGQKRHNYDQRRFQDRFRPSNMYRGQPRYHEDYRGRSRYDSNNRVSYGYDTRGSQRYVRSNNNNNRRGNFRSQNCDRNRSRPYEKQNEDRRDSRSISNSRSRSGQRQLQIEIGLDASNVGNTIILPGTVQLGK